MYKDKKRKNLIILVLGIIILLSFLIVLKFTNLTGFITNDSKNSTVSIRFVIPITETFHLDENREFISDIYNETREFDNIWTETISDEEYVRTTFEKNLTSENHIKIYPRVVNGSPEVEVYEKNQNDLLAKFTNIISNKYNTVFLTKLKGKQDTFDLRVLNGSLILEHVVDPSSEIKK